MIDRLGRSITYLRLSVTERCTLRCAYCRAEEGACPKRAELSAESLVRIVRAAAALGVEKLRVTGGEPMLRRDLLDILRGARETPGIREINMTTNAQHLPGRAAALKAAGLDRLNISIDSLRPERYDKLTGGGALDAVLRGIDEALEAGFAPLKLNAVLLRGVNDDELDDFIALTKDRPIDMRFIELMPLGDEDHGAERIGGDELRARCPLLEPLPPRYAGQPSRDYRLPGHMGRVGFIDAVSHKFCADCNRIRVMSDGMLRPCLGQNAELSLLEALREPDDAALTARIRDAIYHKPAGHGFGAGFVSEKNMSRIGG
ncbi:MAG: GTP 3',8-cyclase MoaA [Clostridia bacterium]|nr:GTP 3',8-cyclase MoaA [Clostridia bacterium]